jgi:lipopolysaccharide biosynthesis glycosyltransferase
LDADYYGFFHYRRYLAVRHPEDNYDIWCNLGEPFIGPDMEEKYGLDAQSIRAAVEGYDVILPERKDIRKMPDMGQTQWEQYVSSGYLHRKDLELMLELVKEESPEMAPVAEKYLNGNMTYLNNMFIMRREIFTKFCEWEFSILKKFCERTDMSNYSVEALRTPGHLAERLVNIYCMYLQENTNYQFKELPTLAIWDTDLFPRLQPAFAEKNVAVALSANDYYVPYLDTVLISIRKAICAENNYDLIVMHRDISIVNQKQLQKVFAKYKNVSLRFLNVTRFGKSFEKLFLHGHFVLETYFRLLLPELLDQYKKVLYLDSDTIVTGDLAELYHTDVEGYLLAACLDPDTAGLYNGYVPQKKAYMDNVLKIKEPYKYFQAGVILFNLEKFRECYTSEEMLKFAASNQWELLDQDVLNYLAQGSVKFVDMNWNVMTDWRRIRIADIISRAPKYLRDAYMQARENPKIIHYAGPDKPWQQPDCDFAEEFWLNARQSSYYEVMMKRLTAQEIDAYKRSLPTLKTQIKWEIKNKIMPVVDRILPKGTKRREAVKRIWRKIRK